MSPAPRDIAARVRDTRSCLEHDVDAWVATAGSQGPWLVPLTFSWDGATLLFATSASSRTARNLAGVPAVRVGLGQTRDVVLIDGDASVVPIDGLDATTADRFAAKTGSDPRGWASAAILVTPRRIQAWREENELDGRLVFDDGQWLT